MKQEIIDLLQYYFLPLIGIVAFGMLIASFIL